MNCCFKDAIQAVCMPCVVLLAKHRLKWGYINEASLFPEGATEGPKKFCKMQILLCHVKFDRKKSKSHNS
jgi:hypothetical protein